MIHIYIFLSLLTISFTSALQKKGFLDIQGLSRFWKSAVVLLPFLLLIILFQTFEWYIALLSLVAHYFVATVVGKAITDLVVPGRVGDFGNYVPGGNGRLKRSYIILTIVRNYGLLLSWIIGLLLIFL